MSLTSEGFGTTAAPKAKNVIERIVGVFFSPSETMQDVAARPGWLVPLLILIVAAGLSGFFLKDVIIQTQLEQLQNRPNMTQEQIEQAQPMMEKWTGIASIVAPLITTPLFYLIIAGVLMFIGNVILGGETRYNTLFSVTCWSGLITVLSSLINVPMMIKREVMESATSLGLLLPPEQNKTTLYYFLSQIDFFMIWWVIVLGFGVAAAYRFSTRKAMTAVFVGWAIYVALAVLLKSIFS
ncbi:MAG: YIP1 family protein [candidate division KSB1 bacterium]|nr:YIP1 family protein [candidate division KSB1 bacterium]MDZ7301973.1 YIP1 family protein [candidate division KSB1 bacterium]MDZ7312378.1 YIP1 family protein [candidate division KSB1 bacterium]